MRSLVLGFHGCDETVGRRLISGEAHLKPSRNPYDWLGDGIYFFENDSARAQHFADTVAKNPDRRLSKGDIHMPFVVGAILDLGFCLDLSRRHGIVEATDARTLLEMAKPGKPPTNKRLYDDDHDFIVRHLDRAIINTLHSSRASGSPALRPYDSVRCPFQQGRPIANTSAFREYSHVQIAVRNLNCILGYFVPPPAVDSTFHNLQP